VKALQRGAMLQRGGEGKFLFASQMPLGDTASTLHHLEGDHVQGKQHEKWEKDHDSQEPFRGCQKM
jgi:hypothetical protein